MSTSTISMPAARRGISMQSNNSAWTTRTAAKFIDGVRFPKGDQPKLENMDIIQLSEVVAKCMDMMNNPPSDTGYVPRQPHWPQIKNQAAVVLQQASLMLGH